MEKKKSLQSFLSAIMQTRVILNELQVVLDEQTAHTLPDMSAAMN